MTSKQPVFIVGGIWELIRFFYLSFVMIVLLNPSFESGPNALISMATGQSLILAAAAFLFGMYPVKFREYRPLVVSAKGVLLLPALVALTRYAWPHLPEILFFGPGPDTALPISFILVTAIDFLVFIAFLVLTIAHYYTHQTAHGKTSDDSLPGIDAGQIKIEDLPAADKE